MNDNNRRNDDLPNLGSGRSVEVVDVELARINRGRPNNNNERLDTSSSIEGQGHNFSMFRSLRRSLFIKILNEILVDLFWVIFWLLVKLDLQSEKLLTEYSRREQTWLCAIMTYFCIQQAGICVHRALLIGVTNNTNRHKII